MTLLGQYFLSAAAPLPGPRPPRGAELPRGDVELPRGELLRLRQGHREPGHAAVGRLRPALGDDQARLPRLPRVGDGVRLLPQAVLARPLARPGQPVLQPRRGGLRPGRALQLGYSRLLRMRGVRVLLRHVRAHRGHAMNERADTLAGLGAQGVRMRDGRPFDPPDYPDPSHARSATPVHPLLPPDTVPD